MVAFKFPIMQGHQPNCISVVGLTATLEGLEHSNPGSQHCSYSGNLVRVNFKGWTNGVLSPFTLKEDTTKEMDILPHENM